jgi:copper homeostasis protein
LITAVRAAVKIDLIVIIRPRGGDFVYSDHELEVMREDVLEARAKGADGVALGILTDKGTVDLQRTRALVELARPLKVTFHRAFDDCKDLDRALEDVIACGTDRLLTSGGAPDAPTGMNAIAHLYKKAGSRIHIMAGGGVRTSNVRDLALHTGIQEVHASLNTKAATTPNGRASAVKSRQDGLAHFVLEENDVRAFISALDALPRETAQSAYAK